MAEDTEERILEAANRIFTRHGFAGTRMHQIADEAEVNKAMLHYYYRSKKQLFRRVYQEAIATLLPQFLELLNSDLELEKKISRFVDRYISLLKEYPRLPSFVLQEINQDPDQLLEHLDSIEVRGPKGPHKFLEQVRRKGREGEIWDIPPKQMFINLMSLCVFPFAARPLIKYMLQMDDREFERMLEDRKPILTRFILKGMQP